MRPIDAMLRVKVVDKLPDVFGIIFLIPKEEKDKSGNTITVYEEYVLMKEKIGEIYPDDFEGVLFYEHGGVLSRDQDNKVNDDVSDVIKERATLPYDAMGDYSNTPYSTGKQSPDEWHRENFGENVKG